LCDLLYFLSDETAVSKLQIIKDLAMILDSGGVKTRIGFGFVLGVNSGFILTALYMSIQSPQCDNVRLFSQSKSNAYFNGSVMVQMIQQHEEDDRAYKGIVDLYIKFT
jgi:hypothetical protein